VKVADFLQEKSADYEVTQHRPTFTAQQMAAEEHVPGMYVAKPVLVRADSAYYMCVLPACCKIDLDGLRAQLGAAHVELADESEMSEVFSDCALGAEPPFGSLYGLETIMDKSLEQDEYIVFQAGSHEEAVKMDMAEYRRLAEPKVLSFSYHSR
jgi:Ala-tRNA(Pro) deacylase